MLVTMTDFRSANDYFFTDAVFEKELTLLTVIMT